MTGREAVRRAIEFSSPGRIPLAKGPSADVAYVGFGPAAGFAPRTQGDNEWGCRLESKNADLGDQGQVLDHPLADWDNVADFHFPDPHAPGRLDAAPAAIEKLRAEGKFICGTIGKGPMHLLPDLRGFEEFLTDLLLEPDRSELLLEKIFTFLTGMTEQFGSLGVDAIFLIDDQAMQTGPMFSMDIWRQRFKPRYKNLCDLAHRLGMKVYMHACGDLRQHLKELAEAGIDMIDNKQPSLWMDCPAVDEVRGQIAFSSCIDIQGTMQKIEKSAIPAETARIIRRLATPEGGFLGTYYHQADLNLQADKIEIMMKAFAEFRWND